MLQFQNLKQKPDILINENQWVSGDDLNSVELSSWHFYMFKNRFNST